MEEVKVGNKTVRARQYPWGVVQGKRHNRNMKCSVINTYYGFTTVMLAVVTTVRHMKCSVINTYHGFTTVMLVVVYYMVFLTKVIIYFKILLTIITNGIWKLPFYCIICGYVIMMGTRLIN